MSPALERIDRPGVSGLNTIGYQIRLPLDGPLVAVRTICQLAELATGGGLKHLNEGFLERPPRPLRERLGLARQDLHHHLRYRLLCSHVCFSFPNYSAKTSVVLRDADTILGSAYRPNELVLVKLR